VRVIGTAGHVDHGKSTLITRLSGINPDRLQEEQEREMSIELGFAWFDLPNGETVGVVDVPGHRDFIENMLAGIGGIDSALFVVAADEGVMPQTREHLAILDLLQIPAGVVALTKTDLIDDPEWLGLVEEDLSETLAGTCLADAPIVPVSARTGDGIPALKEALAEILAEQPYRADLGRPRLPVDRVFTLPGFGTIVTGTLLDGRLQVGESVEILPGRREGRIRGLQTHKESEERAAPGSRTAVNISGISVDAIQRGDVLVHPGSYQPTTLVDVWFTHLPDADAPLKHNTEMKFFLGAAEIMARVRLLGHRELPPGEEAFLQLMLQEPVVALRSDRFILRRPSPAATIGGGQVVDPHPKRRHKRFDPKTIEALEMLLMGSPEEVLLQTLRKLGTPGVAALVEASGLEGDTARRALDALLKDGAVVGLNGQARLISTEAYRRHAEGIEEILSFYHAAHPLRAGMPRERLKSETGLDSQVFDAILERMSKQGILVESGAMVRLQDHLVVFSDSQKAAVEELLAAFDASPYGPPSVRQSEDILGEELLRALIETGRLVQVGEDVLLQPEVVREMQEAVVRQIRSEGGITLAELRDQFDTSRKYAVALLEYLDRKGITVRRGDLRQLRKPSES
jgi:selenocysteine-specific elongation factor